MTKTNLLIILINSHSIFSLYHNSFYTRPIIQLKVKPYCGKENLTPHCECLDFKDYPDGTKASFHPYIYNYRNDTNQLWRSSELNQQEKLNKIDLNYKNEVMLRILDNQIIKDLQKQENEINRLKQELSLDHVSFETKTYITKNKEIKLNQLLNTKNSDYFYYFLDVFPCKCKPGSCQLFDFIQNTDSPSNTWLPTDDFCHKQELFFDYNKSYCEEFPEDCQDKILEDLIYDGAPPDYSDYLDNIATARTSDYAANDTSTYSSNMLLKHNSSVNYVNINSNSSDIDEQQIDQNSNPIYKDYSDFSSYESYSYNNDNNGEAIPQSKFNTSFSTSFNSLNNNNNNTSHTENEYQYHDLNYNNNPYDNTYYYNYPEYNETEERLQHELYIQNKIANSVKIVNQHKILHRGGFTYSFENFISPYIQNNLKNMIEEYESILKLDESRRTIKGEKFKHEFCRIFTNAESLV